MILQKNNLEYYYDKIYDTLNLYIGKANSFYSEEEYNGVFFIKDEETDKIIGYEVMDFSKRNLELLKNRINIDLSSIVIN
jgi:uncharacterized protein YuzE